MFLLYINQLSLVFSSLDTLFSPFMGPQGVAPWYCPADVGVQPHSDHLLRGYHVLSRFPPASLRKMAEFTVLYATWLYEVNVKCFTSTSLQENGLLGTCPRRPRSVPRGGHREWTRSFSSCSQRSRQPAWWVRGAPARTVQDEVPSSAWGRRKSWESDKHRDQFSSLD